MGYRIRLFLERIEQMFRQGFRTTWNLLFLTKRRNYPLYEYTSGSR